MTALANKKMLGIAAAVAVLIGGLFWAVSRGNTLGEMKLRVQKGEAEIQRGDERIAVTDETPVEVDDVVTTGIDSVALIRLEGNRLVTLGEETRIKVLGPSAVANEEGSLLAKAQEPLRIMIDQTAARGAKSLFRVDRRYGTSRTGVYSGAVELSAPGSTDVKIGRLRQAEASANRLFGVAPYQLGDDAWDRLYLEPLFEFNEEIALVRDGFSNQLGKDLPTLDYFKALVDAKDIGFMRPYAADQTPKDPDYTVDLLIGLSVADRSAGNLEKSFERGFGFYEQGATWGVVAGILGVGEKKEWRPIIASLSNSFSGSVAGGDTGDVTFAVSESGEVITSAGDAPGGGTPSDPGRGDPGPGDPGPGDPRPGPTEPGPGPTDPGPTDPGPSEPPPECDPICLPDDPLNPSPEPSPSFLSAPKIRD